MSLDDAVSYRVRQEAFVSNLNGTSMSEIVLVSIPIPLGLWVLSETKALLRALGCRNMVTTFGWSGFILETFLILIPCLASMVWSAGIVLLISTLAFASIFCRFARLVFSEAAFGTPTQISSPNYRKKSSIQLAVDEFELRHLHMVDPVTNFRASFMLMTCISILAVDFQVFPRRFAKTEVFGTGLMDLGVGITIFASGLASGCRRKRREANGRAGNRRWFALFRDMTSVAVRGWPLAALGVSRLFVIKGLGYQEHVTEYGVHWNFFATLYCVRLLVALMAWLHPAHLALWLALLGLLFYQKMLSAGLSNFIEHAPRETLFSMNREGVLGIVGFVAIYFIAEELGSYIQAFRRKSEKEREHAQGYHWSCVVRFGCATVVLWGLTLLSDRFVQPTSRRMVNLSYVLWVSAHSALLLTLLMVVHGFSPCSRPSQMLAAVNINMFPVFLSANLVTGVINVSIRTLDASDVTASTILTIYTIVVALIAVMLVKLKIVIKV